MFRILLPELLKQRPELKSKLLFEKDSPSLLSEEKGDLRKNWEILGPVVTETIWRRPLKDLMDLGPKLKDFIVGFLCDDHSTEKEALKGECKEKKRILPSVQFENKCFTLFNGANHGEAYAVDNFDFVMDRRESL